MIRSALVAIGLALVGATALAADKTDDIATILAHTTDYDGKGVTVTGTVKGVTSGVNHMGRGFDRFQLCDQAQNCVATFIWGHPDEAAEGKTVTVVGKFHAKGSPGPDSDYDEILILSIQ